MFVKNKGEYRIKFSLGGVNPQNSDSIVYVWQDLLDLQVKNASNVLELKERLCKEITNFNPEINVSPDRLRLREKNTDKFGQVLHNSCKMKEYSLYDTKMIAIEILDHPEMTSQEEILLYVKFWDIENLELSEPSSLFIRKKSSIHDLLDKIEEQGCLKNIDVIKIHLFFF